MTKVILDLPKGEIVRILAQLPLEEQEEIIREVGKDNREVKPKYVPIEEVLKLKGIISLGGDALINSERIYDE